MQNIMHQRLTAFFSTSLTLYWKGYFKNQKDGWYADGREQELWLKQLMDDAKIKSIGFVPSFKYEDYDKILTEAGKYGLSIETIGEPEQEITKEETILERLERLCKMPIDFEKVNDVE